MEKCTFFGIDRRTHTRTHRGSYRGGAHLKKKKKNQTIKDKEKSNKIDYLILLTFGISIKKKEFGFLIISGIWNPDGTQVYV